MPVLSHSHARRRVLEEIQLNCVNLSSAMNFKEHKRRAQMNVGELIAAALSLRVFILPRYTYRSRRN